MSTCQGAPAPHLNCKHGERCDWTPSIEQHSYTVGSYIVGAGIVPCVLCGGGRNARVHRCIDSDCDGDFGHGGKHFAWVAE